MDQDPSVQNAEQIPGVGAGATVTSVGRVLDILEAFQRVRKPVSLTELADITGIPKSSCHAIVRTLIARGYLYSLSRPRSLYPTRRIYDVAVETQAHDPIVQQVTPLLERLRDNSRETVILGKRQHDAVIYLQVFESQHAIRYSAKPGHFKPMHSSAIGKALLGSLKEAELRTQLSGRTFPAVTPDTITGAEALVKDIVDSRRRGYFVTRGENVPDVWAVATYLSLRSETLAVAIAGPRHRMEHNVVEHAQVLLATCSLISRQARGA